MTNSPSIGLRRCAKRLALPPGKAMLRSGRIVYTNDLPVYTAFDEGAVHFPGALVADVPSNLNAMLLAGKLDLSPISAVAYGEHPDVFALLPELCIGSPPDRLWGCWGGAVSFVAAL